jgi:adenylate cyclase
MDALVLDGILAVGRFRFDPRTHRLYKRNAAGAWEPVPVGSRAREILRLLLDSPGVVVSKETIMNTVWAGVAVEPNNLAVHMAALRRVLDQDGSDESCIETVPGRGYRLTMPVTPAQEGETGSAPAPTIGPVDTPAPSARSEHSFRRRWVAAWVALAITTTLLVAAWHGGWFSGKPAPPRLSLVVLPFANPSGDASEDYLADAITDDLTTDLSRVRGMVVIGRGTAHGYQGKAVDERKIGEELGVRYVVEGSMRKLGDSLQVNVWLISTETGAQLWANGFDEQVRDLSAGQPKIFERIGQVLNVAVTDIESARSKRERPTNPDAFDLIIRARALRLHPMGPREEAERIALYEQALRLDPTSILALTGLADMLIETRHTPMGDLKRAARLIAEAATIDPDYSGVLEASAYLLLAQGRCTDAIAAYQRLLDEYPNSYFALSHIGSCLIMLGRSQEAVPLIETAILRDPRNGYAWERFQNLGSALLMLGRDEESIVWTQRALAGNPNESPRNRAFYILRLAAAFARLGRFDEAHQALAEANRIWPYYTARSPCPWGSNSPEFAVQIRRFQAALRLAGLRDHAEEDADFGVASDNKLHEDLGGLTPTTAPGARTIRTPELQRLLVERKPIVIDPSECSWGFSIPGAIELRRASWGGSTSDPVEGRLGRKMQELTKGDFSAPIVAVGWNSERFDGRNLALRLVALGYTQVYWYRGGREAWEVDGLPETVSAAQDW